MVKMKRAKEELDVTNAFVTIDIIHSQPIKKVIITISKKQVTLIQNNIDDFLHDEDEERVRIQTNEIYRQSFHDLSKEMLLNTLLI